MKIRIINSFESIIQRRNLSSIAKIKHLKEVTKPLTANATSSAEEKLNKIYLDQKAAGYYTKRIENNIEKFDKLPDSVKKCVRDIDINRDGYVSQDTIDKAWAAAQKSNAYDMRLEPSTPPRFNGRLEESTDVLPHDMDDSGLIPGICDGDNGMAEHLLDSDLPTGNVISKILNWLSDIM